MQGYTHYKMGACEQRSSLQLAFWNKLIILCRSRVHSKTNKKNLAKTPVWVSESAGIVSKLKFSVESGISSWEDVTQDAQSMKQIEL